MKRKPTLLTVDNSSYFRVGDMIRNSSSGDTLICTATNARPISNTVRKTRREWLRGLLTLKFSRWKTAVTATEHTLRVWKWRPSPLPRRLP